MVMEGIFLVGMSPVLTVLSWRGFSALKPKGRGTSQPQPEFTRQSSLCLDSYQNEWGNNHSSLYILYGWVK